ncbi:hypothetical protein [Pseudodesulfovibrio karagichevae]|uniref:Uncharacterized protein n=1 Tax=Pseudodesulfovibrio karagichevae TaxID=3239305 RepID=A0ABV4K084_9BACT
MSKIREQALELIASEIDPGGLTVREGLPLMKMQARRVLLLEKAYRYQRAAWALMNEGIQMQGGPKRTMFVSRSLQYCLKAGELYRQAEEA